ncbi:glycine zipper domain-containing protein [uncultured Halopseudomonas sp.]|uniref:glycine zipper domain-containing protein n=1 Tax=uncultured Halopseudomonas sp. TaxID=2901193 RepID=UPI0030ED43B1|tara:strand:+ start:6193 stop:6777 length:585 start_codon:yes stop_codon:yes gene_type:complete
MSTIIAGRFETQEAAEKVSASLQDTGFAPEQISLFYVNPHGQHDMYPIGGDEPASPGAEKSGRGAVLGGGVGAAAGAAIGLAAAPVVGPVGAVVGGGIGAYTGSLVGAMKETDKESEVDEMADETPLKEEQLTERESGVHVAVKVTADNRSVAINVLRKHQAAGLEEAQGELTDGEWVDFDPREAVKLLPEDQP